MCAFLLACGLLYAQDASEYDVESPARFSLTPMIGAVVDVAPYGIEKVYASAALSASYGGYPFEISLWGMVLASQEDVLFRVPLFFCLRINQDFPLGFLLGGGISSWDSYGTMKIFPVFYGGLNYGLGGSGPGGAWSFTAVLSDISGPGLNDIMLEFYFGRIIGF